MMNLRVQICAVTLMLAIVLVYGQTLWHEFVFFDDALYLYENPHVQHGFSMDSLAWSFTNTWAGNWHPVTWLSHLLDVHLFGMNAGAHHFVSMMLHAMNSLILWVVLRSLTGDVWRSGLVAALFGLHPLHVESVAWLAERKDLLSACFWFLTIAAYARYVRRPGAAAYALVIIAFSLGLMSKAMLVTLPFVLLLLDHWPLNRLGLLSTQPGNTPLPVISPVWLVVEKVPLLILSVLAGFATLAAQRAHSSLSGLDLLPLLPRLTNAIVAYFSYVWKTLWPFDLSFFYPYQSVPDPVLLFTALAVFLTMLVIAVRCFRSSPHVFVGVLWFVGTLVPVIGLIQVGRQSMADRYTYIPLVGLFIAIAWSLPRHSPGKHGWILVTVPIIVLTALASISWRQTRVWSDSVTLCEHALVVTRDNHVVHAFLARLKLEQGATEEAALHALRAVEIDPQNAEGYSMLGNVAYLASDWDSAVKLYQQALELRPDDWVLTFNLALALREAGRLRESLDQFAVTLKYDPTHVAAWRAAGELALQLARLDEALAFANGYLQRVDEKAAAFDLKGRVLLALGRDAERQEVIQLLQEYDEQGKVVRLPFSAEPN